MAEKVTFQKLTEDLDKLNNEELEKSEDQKQEGKEPEVKEVPEVQPEAEPVKPEAEPEVKPEAEPEGEAKVEQEPEAEPKADEDEEVEKSSKKKKEDAKEAAGEEQKPKTGEDAKDAKAKAKKKDEEKVEKSEDSEIGITEQDFIDAFQVVAKSVSSLKTEQLSVVDELATIKKSLSDILSLLNTEQVSKSEGEEKEEDKEEDKKDEKPTEEPLKAEDIEKSVKVEEEPEGKAVEFVSKSTEGVAVPEAPEASEEVQAEEEQEPEFNAVDHVKEVVGYYTNPANNLSVGTRTEIRYAIDRVKRNQGTETDIELFKEIVNFNKN
ncbi:hypothetical protein HWC53_gp243 [Bacillus phage vB_BmeM-Goe8]|uniref:Uncharacterized protein n=1 Tax=Bacillus phage vB_BmeM-Goe8 TaxID=2593638 RepID=A0A516KMP5_9CAUD|nr:hypothetical protein HWC53_gp243 [Bacillus phage vB_BmeM-Goe8]QDP42846.1 hypothetical protein Goe8_c00730 [Bacillus phage vB_BmeM-Goe8]